MSHGFEHGKMRLEHGVAEHVQRIREQSAERGRAARLERGPRELGLRDAKGGRL